MMILYTDENNNRYIDFQTLKNILNIKKSSLYRAVKETDYVNPIKYKNQYLYNEELLYELMKKKLFKRLYEFR